MLLNQVVSNGNCLLNVTQTEGCVGSPNGNINHIIISLYRHVIRILLSQLVRVTVSEISSIHMCEDSWHLPLGNYLLDVPNKVADGETLHQPLQGTENSIS